jgi:hypothetical protein
MAAARRWWRSAGVWNAMPEWRCRSLYQPKHHVRTGERIRSRSFGAGEHPAGHVAAVDVDDHVLILNAGRVSQPGLVPPLHRRVPDHQREPLPEGDAHTSRRSRPQVARVGGVRLGAPAIVARCRTRFTQSRRTPHWLGVCEHVSRGVVVDEIGFDDLDRSWHPDRAQRGAKT